MAPTEKGPAGGGPARAATAALAPPRALPLLFQSR